MYKSGWAKRARVQTLNLHTLTHLPAGLAELRLELLSCHGCAKGRKKVSPPNRPQQLACLHACLPTHLVPMGGAQGLALVPQVLEHELAHLAADVGQVGFWGRAMGGGGGVD